MNNLRALFRRLLPAMLALLMPMPLTQMSMADITTTKHNLSVSGPGTIRASSETQICIFCHAPHNSTSSAPLWNRRDPGSNYIPYSSSTAEVDDPESEAVFISCVNLHTVEIIERLENDLKKPVITSNQATLWNILRLAGITDRIEGFGRLLHD